MIPHARTLLTHLHHLAAPTASEAALLARWLEQRDETAFAELVARHGPMVFGLCRRVLGDVHAAEDAFQATFLVLARKAARVRRPEALPSFLYGVALRLSRKSRGAAAHRRMIPLPPDVPEPADPHPHPLDELSGRELLALLDTEVARLPEVYRLPLLLCLMQGRTVEEAARLLGWSIGSLRGRLARGRERLRQRLTRRGLDLSAGAVALLAPAAVSERLRAECLRNLAASGSPAVNALAAGWTAALKLKAIGLALFIVAAIGLGAALPLLRAPEPETPSAPSPAAPAAQAKNEPHRDRYGDPLPPGAIARLGTLRFRAPGVIETLLFAPDSKTLAVSSRGGLFLFDPASGKRLRRIPSASPDWRPENPIVFSPDGKHLAGLGHKIVGPSALPVVRVWELDGERRTHEYDIGQSVLWLGWSAKNEPLAVHVEKGVLHLHDLAAGRSRRFECKEPQKNPAGTLSVDPAVACSPAGKALAVVDDKNVIHVWDTVTGRERCTLQPKGDGMHSLTFSPDGSRLVSIAPKAVQMWDVAAAKALYTVDATMHYGPIFSADGKTLAILDSWQTIRFWDAATGSERGHTEGKGNFAPHFAFSPEGKALATTDNSGSAIHLWDVATGKRRAEPVGHRNRPYGIFSPDGRRIATSGRLDRTIRVWNPATGDALAEIQRPSEWARDVAFSPNGRLLFSTWTDENLWISDAATGERRHIIKLEDLERPDTYQSAIHSSLSDDGKTLVAFSYYYPKKNGAGPAHQDTLITGWDTSTHKQTFQRRRPGMDSWLALSADTRVLAVPHHDGSTRLRARTPGMGPMRLEDVRTGEPLLTFPALPGQTWPLAFSSDGRLLASNNFQRAEPEKDGTAGKATNTLRLWEIRTAAEVLSLPAADFNRVAFTRDNRLMALAVPKQEIVVWDLRHGREQRRFKGFEAEVIDLAFSPDGRRLISGLADSTLLIWEVGSRDTSTSKLGAEGLAKAWADLASADAPRAFRARGALADAAEETVPFLQKHLHLAQPVDAERLRHLLADLASEQFAVREKAQKALEELGDLAEPALRQTLANKPTLEVRRRVQAVLDRLRGPVTRPEMLRSLRAVAVLEDIGTPSARRLLEKLTEGASESRLTREAKESLRRLALHKPPER